MYITVAMVIVVCMLFFGIYLIGARRIGDMLEMSGMNGDIGESITLKFCDIAVSVLPLVTAMGIGYFPEYVVDFSPTHHVSMVVLVTIPFIQFFGLFCDVILCDVHYDAKNHAGAIMAFTEGLAIGLLMPNAYFISLGKGLLLIMVVSAVGVLVEMGVKAAKETA